MSILLTQSNNSAVSTCAFNSNNTAGNLLIAMARLTNGASNTNISDSQGNVWTNVENIVGLSSSQFHAFWYAANCKAGVNTVTLPSGFGFYQTVVAEYSGVAVVSPQESENHGFSSAAVSSLATGAVVPTKNGELLVSWSASDLVNNTTQSPNSGFTVRNNAAGNVFFSDLIQAIAASVNVTWTVSSPASLSNWSVGLISFKPSSGTSQRTLVGVGT